MSDIIIFDNRDPESGDVAFQHWQDENPRGWLLNTYRQFCARYVVLHRANCPRMRLNNHTNRQYIKVCASSMDDLGNWVRRHGGQCLRGCKSCGVSARRVK
jgi:hypothetical protein